MPRKSASPARARKPRTVLVVDDHPLWRQTLHKLLLVERAADVVLEAGDGPEAIDVAVRAKPDVIVMDMALPTLQGIDATVKVREALPATRVLALSSSDEKRQVLAAVRAGVSGYLVKTAGPGEIVEAVKRVRAGELVFPPALADIVLAELRSGTTPAPVRVVVAADGAVDREGLTKVLREAGFLVVAQASAPAALGDAVTAHAPDVVVVELGSKAAAWGAVVPELQNADRAPGIVLLSDSIEAAAKMGLVARRRLGYLVKERVPDVEGFADAVRRVAAGELVVDPDIVAHLVGRRKGKELLARVTERERHVLELMSEGHSNQAICERLGLSPKTVEAHVRAVFTKLGLLETPDEHRRVRAVLTYLRSS